MILFVLAYLGGALTILSPCILPVLPFAFARADRSFLTSTIPMLGGLTTTFAIVATLAAIGGGWAVAANTYARWFALVMLAGFGISLLLPHVSDVLTRPLVRVGNRLSMQAEQAERGASVLPSLLLGVAIGFLWAPCAGPILGLILTGAALKGASVGTTVLLLAYAAGAATSLALALLIGGKVFIAMKGMLGVGEWVRRTLGLTVLAAVLAIALGVDTGLLSRFSQGSTTALEQGLLRTFAVGTGPAASNLDVFDVARLPDEGPLPSIDGAVQWMNSAPITTAELKGKVVLVDFWTYSCINCIRSVPYIRAWAHKYRDQGLVVIGVHAPEFAFEKNMANVQKALVALKIDYPVAIDNDFTIWRAFNNEYWPAHYFVDRHGRVRHHHFGEGNYAESERVVQALLDEGSAAKTSRGLVSVKASGTEAAADTGDVGSPETYVGSNRADNFASPEEVNDDIATRFTVDKPALNHWGFAGTWLVGGESSRLDEAGGAIVYRFHARDLHLVLGPGPSGKPVRFRVTIDGASPGDNHGVDADSAGNGVVSEQRLYQLVRQKGEVADHTFRIEFLDAGVQAYAFTFG